MLQRIAVTLLILFVLGGHIAMWTSDMPRDLALRLTLINAAGWAVILLPAYGVARWAGMRRQEQARRSPHGKRHAPDTTAKDD